MRNIVLTGIGLLSAVASSVAEQKPNIIIYFADDISARELPVYGSSVWSPPRGGNTTDPRYRAQTPILEKMSKEGCWFQTAWASTVCSPSRAMMMTGRYAHMHKWWNNKDLGRITSIPGDHRPWPLYDSSPLSMGQVAKESGYASLWVGKTQMHGGELERFGFDEGCFTPSGEAVAEEYPFSDFQLVYKKKDGKRVLIDKDNGQVVNTYKQQSWYFKPLVALMNYPGTNKEFVNWPYSEEDKKEYSTSTYGPDVELKFAFDFMERKVKEKKPFFIYHTSHLGHDAFDFLHPEVNAKWPGTPKIHWDGTKYIREKTWITGSNGKYDTHGTVTDSGIHHMINYIDYQLWQYLQELKELGTDQNTIIIFCADNGTSGYGKNSPVCQKGVHVPFLVFAPKDYLTKHGEQDVLVNIADVLPTIAEISGFKFPDSYEINGVSLLPYLTTSTDKHRDWIYSYHKEKQLIRGQHIMKDGLGTWFDVSDQPKDLISYPVIKDWNNVPNEYVKERNALEAILPRFDLHDTEHDEPLIK